MPIYYICYHRYYIQLVKIVKTIGEHYLHTKFESVFSFQFLFFCNFFCNFFSRFVGIQKFVCRQLTAVIINLFIDIDITICAINIVESLRFEGAKYYLTISIYLFISSRINDMSAQSDLSVQYSITVGNTHMSVSVCLFVWVLCGL